MADRLTSVPGVDVAPAPDSSTAAAHLHALEVEVRVLRERLVQRDSVLSQLNHRLLELERGEFSTASPTYVRLQELRHDLQAATQRVVELESALADAQTRAAGIDRELSAMRQTKVFRWSAPLRTLYRLIGGRR